MAYDKLHPLPDPWWIGAQICQVVAASMSGKKTKVEDWIPVPRDRRIMTGEQGRAIFQGLRAQMLAQQATAALDSKRSAPEPKRLPGLIEQAGVSPCSASF